MKTNETSKSRKSMPPLCVTCVPEVHAKEISVERKKTGEFIAQLLNSLKVNDNIKLSSAPRKLTDRNKAFSADCETMGVISKQMQGYRSSVRGSSVTPEFRGPAPELIGVLSGHLKCKVLPSAEALQSRSVTPQLDRRNTDDWLRFAREGISSISTHNSSLTLESKNTQEYLDFCNISSADDDWMLTTSPNDSTNKSRNDVPKNIKGSFDQPSIEFNTCKNSSLTAQGSEEDQNDNSVSHKASSNSASFETAGWEIVNNSSEPGFIEAKHTEETKDCKAQSNSNKKYYGNELPDFEFSNETFILNKEIIPCIEERPHTEVQTKAMEDNKTFNDVKAHNFIFKEENIIVNSASISGTFANSSLPQEICQTLNSVSHIWPNKTCETDEGDELLIKSEDLLDYAQKDVIRDKSSSAESFKSIDGFRTKNPDEKCGIINGIKGSRNDLKYYNKQKIDTKYNIQDETHQGSDNYGLLHRDAFQTEMPLIESQKEQHEVTDDSLENEEVACQSHTDSFRSLPTDVPKRCVSRGFSISQSNSPEKYTARELVYGKDEILRKDEDTLSVKILSRDGSVRPLSMRPSSRSENRSRSALGALSLLKSRQSALDRCDFPDVEKTYASFVPSLHSSCLSDSNSGSRSKTTTITNDETVSGQKNDMVYSSNESHTSTKPSYGLSNRLPSGNAHDKFSVNGLYGVGPLQNLTEECNNACSQIVHTENGIESVEEFQQDFPQLSIISFAEKDELHISSPCRISSPNMFSAGTSDVNIQSHKILMIQSENEFHTTSIFQKETPEVAKITISGSAIMHITPPHMISSAENIIKTAGVMTSDDCSHRAWHIHSPKMPKIGKSEPPDEVSFQHNNQTQCDTGIDFDRKKSSKTVCQSRHISQKKRLLSGGPTGPTQSSDSHQKHLSAQGSNGSSRSTSESLDSSITTACITQEIDTPTPAADPKAEMWTSSNSPEQIDTNSYYNNCNKKSQEKTKGRALSEARSIKKLAQLLISPPSTMNDKCHLCNDHSGYGSMAGDVDAALTTIEVYSMQVMQPVNFAMPSNEIFEDKCSKTEKDVMIDDQFGIQSNYEPKLTPVGANHENQESNNARNIETDNEKSDGCRIVLKPLSIPEIHNSPSSSHGDCIEIIKDSDNISQKKSTNLKGSEDVAIKLTLSNELDQILPARVPSDKATVLEIDHSRSSMTTISLSESAPKFGLQHLDGGKNTDSQHYTCLALQNDSNPCGKANSEFAKQDIKEQPSNLRTVVNGLTTKQKVEYSVATFLTLATLITVLAVIISV